MEVYKNTSNTVYKYIHDDGSETAIKDVMSGKYIMEDGVVKALFKENNKYSIMISSSVGCNIKCKFCYLTIKKCPYKVLTVNQIFNNVMEAISHQVIETPDITKKAAKLCFMGMGDCFSDLNKTYRVALKVKDYLLKHRFATHIESIDLGTVFPKIMKVSLPESDIVRLNFDNNIERGVRIFYSGHMYSEIMRSMWMPGANYDVQQVFNQLNIYNKFTKIPFILHHIFLHNVNDDDIVIGQIAYLNPPQLRVLRYNQCPQGPYLESSKFNELMIKLSSTLPNVKYQISPGSEIQAACGQFIVNIGDNYIG